MGTFVDSSAETQIRLINHLSKKTLGTRYARTLRQILRYFKYFIKEGHLLDDLPFGLWLGMILTVRVESMGLWGT